VSTFTSRLMLSRMPRRSSVSAAGTLAALALMALWVALPVTAAQASTASCPATTLSQPFLKWSDASYYSLVAGGDFESSPSSWTLSGGATRAAGSEPYAVTGTLGGWSLALPRGASAQSPFTCVEPSDRTFRFFDRSEGTEASVLASVVYKTPLGNVAIPVGLLTVKKSWEPSAILNTGAAIATAVSGNTAQVALRFSALSGTARIDDVFIDPRLRR
jgi:hypothetical protein